MKGQFPAFPCVFYDHNGIEMTVRDQWLGISERDYMATHIISGLCNQIELTQSGNFMMKVAADVMAKLAYEITDAMLEARDE
jgi:hypothetical protein